MNSIANEVQAQIKERSPLSIWRVLKNRWFLYAVSTIAFFIIWEYVALNRFLGSALARPYEVLLQLADMMVNPIAGKGLIGHIWASTQRILIGFAIGACSCDSIGSFHGLKPIC